MSHIMARKPGARLVIHRGVEDSAELVVLCQTNGVVAAHS